jgi:hypothetical protein
MLAIAGWVLGFLITFGIAVLAFVWALVARVMIWAKSPRPVNKFERELKLKLFDLELVMWLAVLVGCAASLVGLVFFAP